MMMYLSYLKVFSLLSFNKSLLWFKINLFNFSLIKTNIYILLTYLNVFKINKFWENTIYFELLLA